MTKKLIIIFIFFTGLLYADIRPQMTAFNAGELSPLLQMRSDFSKYDSGCATLQNMLPRSQGPVFRRPGTKFIAETATSTNQSRLIPFEFNKTDAYILEFGDLSMRVYRDGGQVLELTGTSTVPSSAVAQWKLDDDAASTVVLDAVGSPTHNGTATTNTSNLSVTGQVDDAFNMQGTHTVTIADHDDFTFDDSAGEGMSIVAWVFVESGNSQQTIVSKYHRNISAREWLLSITSNEYIKLDLWDETNDDFVRKSIWNSISDGWHHIAVIYDGRGGSDADEGIVFYIDNQIWEEGFVDGSTGSGYTNMRNTQASVTIGADKAAIGNDELQNFWQNKLDNIALFNAELTPSEISDMFSASSTFQLTTTYTNDEVADLQYVQVSDILYLVHTNHEPRKLSRAGHTDWTIQDINYEDGPFLDENASPTYTITPSGTATNTTITLTASSSTFTSNDVGALWKLRHPRTDATLSGSLTTNESSSAIDCEGDFNLTTHGTWTGTIDLERSRDGGTTWERVSGGRTSSKDDANTDFSGNEPDSGFIYRVTMTNYSTGTCTYDFVVFDHFHTGIARINAYTSSTVVSATVTTAMGSTTATNYWSEGYWSPKNGYPQTVEFHQFRLFYGGNRSYPQTIWASKVEDYELMDTGTDADDALIYLLPGQNPIQWLLSNTYLMIGTLGGAGRLGEQDESMAPTTQPQYLQQYGYGSKYMQAVLGGDAILYIERGGEKVREFVYNFERDRFVAPDLTVLAEHITGDGIVDIAYQSRPDSILWCVREDGELLSLTYNREQDVVAWSLHNMDGDVESAAVIPGTNEDEVWLIVERTINSAVKRYIEQIQPHDWGNDNADMFFVDSGLTFDGGDAQNISNATQASPCVITVVIWPTDGEGNNLADGEQIEILNVIGMTELNGNVYTVSSASVTTKTFELKNSVNTLFIDSSSFTTYTSAGTVQRVENSFTGFGHLEGEVASVLADAEAQSNVTISSGAYSIDVWANKVHAGLPYTSILKTMPIVVDGAVGAKTRVSRANINFYQSLGTLYGLAGDTEECFVSTTTLQTDWRYLGFEQNTRNAHIYIEQAKPLPLTIRAIIPSIVITEN